MSAGNVNSEDEENKSGLQKSSRTIDNVSRLKRKSVLDKRTTYATYAAFNAEGQ